MGPDDPLETWNRNTFLINIVSSNVFSKQHRAPLNILYFITLCKVLNTRSYNKLYIRYRYIPGVRWGPGPWRCWFRPWRFTATSSALKVQNKSFSKLLSRYWPHEGLCVLSATSKPPNLSPLFKPLPNSLLPRSSSSSSSSSSSLPASSPSQAV